LWDRGDKIDLTHLVNVFNNERLPPPEFRPVEIHIKPDGSIKGRSSLAITLRGKTGAHAYVQISAEMLRPVFRVLEVLEEENGIREDLERKGLA
jgi:hypothetical protein